MSLPVGISDFDKSTELNSIKNTILSGQVPASCQPCISNEQQGLTSTRQDALRDWPEYRIQAPDRVEYLDLRYNNLCNFACRTCEPSYSSSIERELENNTSLKKYFNPINKLDYSTIVNKDLHPHYQSLQRLNLTGGEPLLIKENLIILEELIAVDKNDIDLLITTNASTVNPKMLALIKQFKNVHWTLSIDGIGATAEYIRYGSNWPVIVKNIQSILELKHSVSINTTVSAYSILDISSLVKWFKSLKEEYSDQPFEIMFHAVQWPVYLAPQVTPYLDRACSELEQAIDILKTVKNNPAYEVDNLNNLHKILKNSIIQHTDKFFEFTHQIDQIRQQDFYQTFNLERA
jgi:pyruvate-formate lyase-activating enzyme